MRINFAYSMMFKAILGLLFLGSCGGYSPLPGVAGAAVTGAKFTNSIQFCGHEWNIKSSVGRVGPGPNTFSDLPTDVFVDENGHLHLKISKRIVNEKVVWTSSELVSKESFGYGQYVFQLQSSVESLDKNIVLGFFTWSDNPAFNNREIDIEIGKWGHDVPQEGQYVVWPLKSGNIARFRLGEMALSPNTYKLSWYPGEVFFQSYRGNSLAPLALDKNIAAWRFTGNDVPPAGDEKVRMNLWLVGGAPPSDGKEAEVVINCFHWLP